VFSGTKGIFHLFVEPFLKQSSTSVSGISSRQKKSIEIAWLQTKRLQPVRWRIDKNRVHPQHYLLECHYVVFRAAGWLCKDDLLVCHGEKRQIAFFVALLANTKIF
jgi:hypothetical protein